MDSWEKNPTSPKKTKTQIHHGLFSKKMLLLHQGHPKPWVIRAPFAGWPTPWQGTVTP